MKFLLVLMVGGMLGSVSAVNLSDLKNFLDSTNAYGNVSKPGVYKGQQAGYYTGGSMYLKFPRRNFKLFNIALPRITAGCGGIDAYLGAFSMINSAQLVAAAKNFGANAVGVLFYEALESINPVIAKNISKFQQWANQLNGRNIDSCNTAKWAVNSALGKQRKAENAKCSTMAAFTGSYSDQAAAKQGCNSGVNKSAAVGQIKNDPSLAGHLDFALNVTYDVLRYVNSSGFSKGVVSNNDTEIARLLMSVGGVVIYRPAGLPGVKGSSSYQTFMSDASQGKNMALVSKPPLIVGPEQIHTLIYGGSTNGVATTFKVYECDSSRLSASDNLKYPCLFVKVNKNYTISNNKAIKFIIQSQLDGIVSSLLNETPLSAGQRSLLSSTSLPILKMLNVTLAYRPTTIGQTISNYAEIMALEYVDAYLNSLLRTVEKAVANYQKKAAVLKVQIKQIANVRKKLRTFMQAKREHVRFQVELVEKIKHTEKLLISTMSTLLRRNLNFSNNAR